MDTPHDEKKVEVGHVEDRTESLSAEAPAAVKIKQLNGEMYEEALAKYGQDGDIDPEAEKRLKRSVRTVARLPPLASTSTKDAFS